jgi:general secretion pathway protein L
MQIGAIWGRWIKVLAALLLACRDVWRAQRLLIVSHDADRLIVRQAKPDSNPIIRLMRPTGPESTSAESVLAELPPETPAPDDVRRAAQSGLVVFQLPTDKLVVRRISVPTQAREFLPGIVRNQAERLSPWPVEQTVYGFSAEASHQEEAATLDVRVFITSRAAVNNARDQLDAIGLAPDRIVARQGDLPTVPSVALWSRLADAPPETIERTHWQIGMAIVAIFLLSVGLSVGAFCSAASLRAESEELAARSMTLQRQLQGSHTPQAIASLPPAERAWAWKESMPSTVIVLEVLSRALPDMAYLTELHLDNTTLRMIGLASDTPSLIAPLERSGHLTHVHFFAPTTRGPDGSLFRFHIEAQVVPRLEVTEN